MMIRLKITLLLLLTSLLSTAQTTVQFSEPHQFVHVSERFISIKIAVNAMDIYNSKDPIIVQLFSNLEDIGTLGVTTNCSVDKVILPEQYSDAVEIRLPFDPEALKEAKSISLFLQKKGQNERFSISKNTHTIIVNKAAKKTSHIGLSPISENAGKAAVVNAEKIEVPLTITARGYVPVPTDDAMIYVDVKGIDESSGLNRFPLADAAVTHIFRIKKQQHSEVHQKIMALLDDQQPLELEISKITHRSKHRIREDILKRSAKFKLKKTGGVDVRYSFYLGTNFEFATTFKAKDIEYALDVSMLNLFKDQWGLRAGMYKNTTSRYLEDFMLIPAYYDFIGETPTGQIYDLIETGMVPGVTTESLGFYFNLPYKLINSERFHLYISPHLELIERRETYTYELAYENSLSTQITPYVLHLNLPPLLPKEVSAKYWEAYIGLSAPILYRNFSSDFEVTVNPILGMGYPGPYAVFTLFYTGVKDYNYVQLVEYNSGPRFFSAFQFNIIINPKESLGIKLGSDVRKFFGAERKPVITINLSTKIEFSELFNMIGGQQQP